MIIRAFLCVFAFVATQITTKCQKVGNPFLTGVVPEAEISLPPADTGAPFQIFKAYDLSPLGYDEAEYFISGEARSFMPVLTELGEDGKWIVAEKDRADYKTRIVVYKPSDPANFNGTVVVEWLNVSGGVDAGADWVNLHTELLREGYGWVGVSAQINGIEGPSPLTLKSNNPARYGSLSHPGDDYSYDTYSQVAKYIVDPEGENIFAGYNVESLLAVGQSQSASRLFNYVNALQIPTHLFDGFFLHSRVKAAIPMSDNPDGFSGKPPAVSFVRDDIDVPVFQLQMEGDLIVFNTEELRQPDTLVHRWWEVPGTGHADVYIASYGATDIGNSPEAFQPVEVGALVPGIVNCNEPVNSGPQHIVAKAAFEAFDNWVQDGTLPRIAPRIDWNFEADEPFRDANGNASGGIRTPYVDVPIATLSGRRQAGGGFCFLFGVTELFDTAKLRTLYADKADYVAQVEASTDEAVALGYILPEEAVFVKQAAALTQDWDAIAVE